MTDGGDAGLSPAEEELERAKAEDNPLRVASLKLTVVARQLWYAFDQAVERTGLSRAKWGVIAAVSRRPGETQRVYASLLEVSEVTAGRMIDRLCADGLLERREDPQDRRANRIFLTADAQPVLDRLGELARAHEQAAFAGLGDSEIALLAALLEKIGENLAGQRPSIPRSRRIDAGCEETTEA